MGKYEDYYQNVVGKDINMIKGKPSEIKETDNKNLVILSEDQFEQKITTYEYDLVVLATGMEPSTASDKIPVDFKYDVDGFAVNGSIPGIYAAGCTRKPGDVATSVQDATAAVIKALQSIAKEVS